MRLCLARLVTPRLTRAIYPASLFQAVRGPGLHARRVGVGENVCAAVLADVLGVVADQAVALAGDPVLDLARGRELEAFLDAALGLELGHFRLLVCPRGRGGDVYPTATACLLAGPLVFQRSGKRGAIER